MADYAHIPKGATLDVQPYKVDVPEEELQHFKDLLRLSRIGPKTYENSAFPDAVKYGVTHEWLSETKKYWENSYDWRTREAFFNSFPQFHAEVRDDESNFTFDMHFVALFSDKPDAIPIVFLHGWPGSFLEFLGVLNHFRSKYQPGDLPFHLIVPSMPGYTLSSGPPLDKDFNVEDIARVIHKLVTGIGFKEYVIQGGDIGSYTCRPLAKYPGVKAVHLNFSMIDKPDGVDDSEMNEVESKQLERARGFGLVNSAYAVEHGTKPATIGLVLDSSPLALLAWIGEKFLTWSDAQPTAEAILDSITLYWFSKSFSRCIFPYRQFHGSLAGTYFIHKDPKYHIDQPFGYSYFPEEIAPMPKSWVATTGNLVFAKQHEHGGHFAAMERPVDIANDVEEFVNQVWKK